MWKPKALSSRPKKKAPSRNLENCSENVGAICIKLVIYLWLKILWSSILLKQQTVQKLEKLQKNWMVLQFFQKALSLHTQHTLCTHSCDFYRHSPVSEATTGRCSMKKIQLKYTCVHLLANLQIVDVQKFLVKLFLLETSQRWFLNLQISHRGSYWQFSTKEVFS